MMEEATIIQEYSNNSFAGFVVISIAAEGVTPLRIALSCPHHHGCSWVWLSAPCMSREQWRSPSPEDDGEGQVGKREKSVVVMMPPGGGKATR
jgi:hypothetical protein